MKRKKRGIKEEIERREKIIRRAIEEQKGKIDPRMLENIGREYVKVQELKDRLLSEKFHEQLKKLNRTMLEMKDGQTVIMNLPIKSEQDMVTVSRKGEVITVEGKTIHWKLKKVKLEDKVIFEPV